MRQSALPKVRCSPGHRANQTQALSRQDLRRLALLLSISIILTFWIAGGSATAEMLFQSPQSPVPEQPAQQAPPAQPQPEPAPVEQAPVEQQPVESQPVEQQPAESEQTEQTGTDQSTTDEPVAVDTPIAPVEETGSEPPIPEEPAPEPVPFSREPVTPNEDGISNDSTGSPNFILDRIELIDSVVVSTAYVWLCCGVLLFLLVPVFMLFLYLRGRSQIAREEGF